MLLAVPFRFAGWVCSWIVVLGLGGSALSADVSLPGLFTDHMVLQQGQPIPVWGFAAPGEPVQVSLGSHRAKTRAGPTGTWSVRLPAMEASMVPTTLEICGANVLRVTDVFIGEVWLAAGQSNMAFKTSSTEEAREVVAEDDHGHVRLFTVPRRVAVVPDQILGGQWQVATPENVANFSAIGIQFAREIRKARGAPVGIILAAWGGTPVQSWMSLRAMKRAGAVQEWRDARERHESVQKSQAVRQRYEEHLLAWTRESKMAASPEHPRLAPVNPDPFGSPGPRQKPTAPTVVFNAMIAPLRDYGIRGVIWYQGERNTYSPMPYAGLFKNLITDWRAQWGDESLPFIYVQLPGYRGDAGNGWAWLREAQTQALSLPQTAMAVAIDSGDPDDIHPVSKKQVAHRLALAARAIAYNEEVTFAAPKITGSQREGGRMRLNFEPGLRSLFIGRPPWTPKNPPALPTDRLVGFTIAGNDRVWHAAEARIDGTSILVESVAVPHPVAVRYCWENAPRGNLYGDSLLPVAPFRTDHWPPTAQELPDLLSADSSSP